MKNHPACIPPFARTTVRLLSVLATLTCASAALAYTAIKQTKTIPGAAGPNITFNVFLPADYNDAGNTTEYPVIYHLHGLGGNYTKHNTEVVDAHESAVALGLMEPAIIVFPDGHGDSFWANSYNNSIRAEDDVMDVIIPYVDVTYRTLCSAGSPDFRAIQGFSMGGFGAAKFATKFPETFAVCVIYDGALLKWPNIVSSHPSVASAMFNNNQANFDPYSPWFHVVNNSAAINSYPLPFRQLRGSLSYPPLFDTELANNGMIHEYYDTGCGHDMPCLADPTPAADLAASRRCWEFIQEAFDAAGGGGPTTVSFDGLAEDGWVLESTETSGAGGSNNGGGQNLLVGDSATRQQYRAILSFDTSDLPDGAVITAATLKLKRTAGTAPANLGSLQAAIKTGTFGAAGIENGDFSATPTTSAVATLNVPAAVGGLATGPLTSGLGAISKTGKTQFRLAFTLDDDNDGAADHVDFGSGNNAANLPVLEVTYE